MSEWRTITQVAEETDIPAETVRRYVRQYGDYLVTSRGQRRAYLLNVNSIDTIRKIRYLLDQGNQQEQVEDILQQTEAITIQTDNEEMNEYMLTLPQLHRQMSNEIQSLYEQAEEQNELIRTLTRRLDEQQKEIKERDEQIMKMLNESLEKQKEIAEESKRGFFDKLFKR